MGLKVAFEPWSPTFAPKTLTFHTLSDPLRNVDKNGLNPGWKSLSDMDPEAALTQHNTSDVVAPATMVVTAHVGTS